MSQDNGKTSPESIAAITARRVAEIITLAILRIRAEGATTAVPGGNVEEVVAALIATARTIVDLAGSAELRTDVAVALEFANEGPRTLDELKVNRRPRRAGYQNRPVVPQGSAEASSALPERLQAGDDALRIPEGASGGVEIEASDARLGNRLHAWVWEAAATWPSMDRPARARSFCDAVAIVRDLKGLKAESLAAMRQVLDQQASLPDEERAPSLVRWFVVGSKLGAALSDEIADTDGHNEVVGLMNAIADTLDTIGSGRRTALAPLLDDPDPRVRASAGAYLLALMPDRVLPVLRAVQESERGNSAHFTAFWSIAYWEREGAQTS